MSISGAVVELNKEIDHLTKEIERITKVRDSLLHGASGRSGSGIPPTTATTAPVSRRDYARSAGPANAASAKKAVPVKQAAPGAKKRSMSPEGKKRISDANKKRWAAIRAAKTAK